MRNRAKRRVREAYRLLCKATPENEADREQQTKLLKILRQWYAVVWVLKSEVLSVDFQEIRQSVSECILTAQVKHGRTLRDKQ